MLILQQGQSLEAKKGTAWWRNTSMEWKMAFNEAVFGKGPTIEPPKEEELILLLTRATALRFAGPTAHAPNLSQIPGDLSAIGGLEHLTYLSFTDSKVTSLREIRGLIQLTNLFVYNNQLTSLEGIERMKGLVELACHNNQITSLKPVQHLTNLQTLCVNNNQLESLEAITLEHENNLRDFRVMPNEQLRHREIIRVQNDFGILCRKG